MILPLIPKFDNVSFILIERQVGNHLEGIPFYGPRSDISGPEISNRLTGSKRSNSDSAFMGPRDGIPQMVHESLENLHLMKVSFKMPSHSSSILINVKNFSCGLFLFIFIFHVGTQMLKNGGSGERPRRSNDDEGFYGMPMRPTSASLILQPSAGSRLDANASKWEISIPMGAGVQYPHRGGQFVPFTHQVPTSRYRDTNAGPSIVSQAADEGSRTGIKGPGILGSINAGSGVSEKNSSGVLLSGSKPKTGSHISEPEASTPSR